MPAERKRRPRRVDAVGRPATGPGRVGLGAPRGCRVGIRSAAGSVAPGASSRHVGRGPGAGTSHRPPAERAPRPANRPGAACYPSARIHTSAASTSQSQSDPGHRSEATPIMRPLEHAGTSFRRRRGSPRSCPMHLSWGHSRGEVNDPPLRDRRYWSSKRPYMNGRHDDSDTALAPQGAPWPARSSDLSTNCTSMRGRLTGKSFLRRTAGTG
jgi:hypothetical protein